MKVGTIYRAGCREPEFWSPCSPAPKPIACSHVIESVDSAIFGNFNDFQITSLGRNKTPNNLGQNGQHLTSHGTYNKHKRGDAAHPERAYYIC